MNERLPVISDMWSDTRDWHPARLTAATAAKTTEIFMKGLDFPLGWFSQKPCYFKGLTQSMRDKKLYASKRSKKSIPLSRATA